MFLSNGVLSWLAEYPFNEPVPAFIADGRYPGDVTPFANTGFIASAYMHFGLAGIVVYSALVGLLLRVYDSLILGRLPVAFGTGIAAVAAFQLVNSDLTIAFATQGVVLGIVLLWLSGTVAPRSGTVAQPAGPPPTTTGFQWQ